MGIGELARTAALSALAVVIAGCGTSTPTLPEPLALYINELMAENDATIEDPDGSGGYPDWIEIYNAGDVDVDLGGMYLTDDLTNPTQWRIPDGVVIPAGGHLLFWADNDEEQGETHTNFKLDAEGEAVGLFDTAENGYAEIDAVTFGTQTSDVSFGRQVDGSDTWQSLSEPTPGRSND
ncbi:MAG: lamin tail domain-containing protein [Phycisphaerae bacterium]|nr:lamin tail domain-containing protein [Phycisphaerae bacterium]